MSALSPDMAWQEVSSEEAMTNIVMILETLLLNGFEKFDGREADKYCEVSFSNWMLNLQFKMSYDFAEKVRIALNKLSPSEALNEVRQLWLNHKAG